MYLAGFNMRITALLFGVLAISACAPSSVGNSASVVPDGQVSEIAITSEVVARLRKKEQASHLPPLPRDHSRYIYRLGVGDQLLINISMIASQTVTSRGGVVDLSSRSGLTDSQLGIAVSADGVIDVPILGAMKVVGKTVAQVRELLYAEAKRYFKYPLVEVKILEYRSHQVAVTGAIKTPTTVTLDASALHVAQLIEQAGGVLPEADLRNSFVVHESSERVPIDLVELLVNGDQDYNYRLHAGDVLHVPVTHQNRIFVFGEVIRPQAHTMPPVSYSLADALADSLGPNPVTSSDMAYVVRGAVTESQVKAIRARGESAFEGAGALGKLKIYTLDLDARESYALADRFQMQPRDVVYVSTALITQWGRFINQLLPLGLSTAVTAGTNVQNSN